MRNDSAFAHQVSASENSGRNRRSRSFGLRARAFRPCHRSNRELHHPGIMFFCKNISV